MKISITLIVVAATLTAARPVFSDDFDVTNVERIHARRQFARRSEDFDLSNLARNHVRRQFARRSENDDHLAGHHVRRQNVPDCNVTFDECVAQCGDNACEDQCDQEKSECLQSEPQIPDDDDKIDVAQSNRESLVRRQNTPDCNAEFDECADKCGANICLATGEGTNCPNEACHNQCDEEKTQCDQNRSQGQNRLKRRANAGNPEMQEVTLMRRSEEMALRRRSEEVALRRRSEEVALRRRHSQRQNRLKRRADAEYPQMQEAVLRRRSERSLVRRQNAPDCNGDLVQCVDQCVDSTCEDQCEKENFDCRRNSQLNRRQIQLRRRTEM